MHDYKTAPFWNKDIGVTRCDDRYFVMHVTCVLNSSFMYPHARGVPLTLLDPSKFCKACCRVQRSGARLGNRDVAPVAVLQSRPPGAPLQVWHTSSSSVTGRE